MEPGFRLSNASLLNLVGSATDAKDKVVARLFEKPSRKDDPWAACSIRRCPRPSLRPQQPTWAVNADNAAQAKCGDVEGGDK